MKVTVSLLFKPAARKKVLEPGEDGEDFRNSIIGCCRYLNGHSGATKDRRAISYSFGQEACNFDGSMYFSMQTRMTSLS